MTDALLLVLVLGAVVLALADLAALATWMRRKRDLDCRPKCCVAAN